MRKLIIFSSVLLAVISTAFVKFDTGHYKAPPPVISLDNSFIFGTINDEFDNGSDYSHADTLGINISHRYTGDEWVTFNGIARRVPKGRTANDKLFTDVGDYEDEVTDYLKDLYDDHDGRRSVTMRPKIEWLCHGQSSIYEAEPVSTADDLWFYSFNDHNTGTDVTDSGKTVMYCEQGNDSPGYVVKRLKANTEQSNKSDLYDGDEKCEWYVKPRIRIPASFISGNEEAGVCVIHILQGDESYKISPDTIKAKHFLDNNLQYDGSYLEEFYFNPQNPPTAISFTGILDSNWWFCARGTRYDDVNLLNKADIKVEWLGNCDMWLDYVKVENDIANELFKGIRDPWIQDEVEQIAFDGNPSSVPLMMKFYMELSQFNNLPCMKYVNDKLKDYSYSYSSGAYTVDLMADYNYFNSVHVPFDKRGDLADPEWIYDNYVQKVGFTQFFAESYPMTTDYYENPPNSSCFSKIPNTLPYTGGTVNDRVFGYPVGPDAYDAWLQDNLNRYPYENETNDGSPPAIEDQLPCGSVWRFQEAGQFGYTMRLGDAISKMGNIPFLLMPQAHLWYTKGEARREPTNEEIDLMSNIAVSYGVKGLIYFLFPSFPDRHDSGGSCWEFRDGIVDTNGNFIQENAYQQPDAKWEQIRKVSQRMKTWEPYILKFTDNRKSYSYHEEKNELTANTYFTDIVTYKPQGSPPYEYTSEDNVNERYVQAATFIPEAPEDVYTRYFMIVNRRCSPYYDSTSVSNNGGRRRIKVQFTGSPIIIWLNYLNWKIIDVETNEVVATFFQTPPNPSALVDLGMFDPGEGRLFKLQPVAVGGGLLAGNEVISGNITCFDTVFTNGYNLTISDSTTITFDTNGTIVANGGNFICGTDAGYGVTLNSSSPHWNGIQINGCDTVMIHSTTVNNIKDSAYAFDMVNCETIEMGDNVFNSGTCGAIRGTFSDTALNPVIVLSGNEFNTTSNIIPILSFSANSSSSFPIVIDANTFYGPGSSSSSAIMINNITGGVIKNNVISDFNISVLALSSGMDLYNNTMTSPTTDCILSVASGSILDMKPSGGKLTAGFNSLSTTDEGANNVEVYDSYFYVNGGFNTFDLVKEYTGYHLTGYFPASEGTHSLDYNCFTEDGSDISPVYNVTWGSGGDPVSFGFNYDCNAGEGSGYSSRTEDNLLIVPVTDYYNDTIIVKSGNYTLTTSDSMSIETRKRNYEKVIDLAESILENDPGSREAVDAVSKLYLASLRLDSAGSKMTALKAFLEQLILNNGNKPDLVKRAFYFIQKCKSALGQYQSAMTGFEDIVNNNPNTYDALVASWDYAATSLLLNGGSSGGNRPIINVQSSMFSDEEMFKVNSFDDDPDDRSKLTKEQKPSYVNTPEGRQQVKVNVIKSFEETRKEEINVINNLRDRSEKGDRSAKKELRRREILQDVVKKRQPNDIYEHINDVSSDIRTVFNSTDDNSIKKEQNSVPTEFELSQNFPNPFNPATKIQYALPHDGKVQLVIYDILGREVVKLVNNEFRTAGRYISEFNGSRLASGVYFYRIMVNEGKDFNKVKKMVLVK